MEKENYFNSGTKEFLDKYGLQRIQYSFFDKFRFIVTAGLGLVAALAWDESLRTIFHELFSNINPGLESLGYAVTLTLLATVIGLTLGKVSRKRPTKV